MARTLKAINGNGIDTKALRRLRMPYGNAFVNHLQAVLLEVRNVLLRRISRGLHDTYARLDNRLPIFRVRAWDNRWEYGQVYPERLVRHRPAADDLFSQILRCRLRQGRQKSQRSGVGHGGHQFRARHPLHAALYDWMLDTELLGNARHEHLAGASILVCGQAFQNRLEDGWNRILSCHKNSVQGDDAVRPDQDRVQIYRFDTIVRCRKSRQTDQSVGQGIDIDGWIVPVAGKQGIALDPLNHPESFSAIERRDAEGHVVEKLRKDPAKPEHDDRPEHGIAIDAQNGFNPFARHRPDRNAFDFCSGPPRGGALAQCAIGRPYSFFALKVQNDTADFGFMLDIGRDVLHGDRFTDRVG